MNVPCEKVIMEYYWWIIYVVLGSICHFYIKSVMLSSTRQPARQKRDNKNLIKSEVSQIKCCCCFFTSLENDCEVVLMNFELKKYFQKKENASVGVFLERHCCSDRGMTRGETKWKLECREWTVNSDRQENKKKRKGKNSQILKALGSIFKAGKEWAITAVSKVGILQHAEKRRGIMWNGIVTHAVDGIF